jgi:hypothetical protein
MALTESYGKINMTQLSSNRVPRRGRIFPERQLSAEEKAKRKVERESLSALSSYF